MKCAHFVFALAVLLSWVVVTPSAQAQTYTESILHSFTGSPDGEGAWAGLVQDAQGNFYGTTFWGGTSGLGTVFKVDPTGNETVLYSFTGGADGGNPRGSVIFDSVGNLYGTTMFGGAIDCAYSRGYVGCGAVFELSPVEAGWTETVLYSFQGGTDGVNPVSLIMDQEGNLYGTTYGGETAPFSVFELSPSGGGWTEQVIYGPETETGSFAGLTMDAAGNIFAPTEYSVFELSPNGNGGWNTTVIHNFAGYPKDGLDAEGTPVLDRAGNLYGTTAFGGNYDGGTVFKLSLGRLGWTETVLHSFYNDTQLRAGIVFDAAGNMYGTTALYGKSGHGTVFEIIDRNGRYGAENVIWNFNGTDGSAPESSLILDSAGNLYGTTYNGGAGCAYPGCGTVFKLTPATATTTTLTSFPNPSAYGQAVTFTAVVTSSIGAPPDGETVTFMKGTTILGTGTLSGGSAGSGTSTLSVGTSSITAVYGGDSNLGGSTSKPVKQVVSKATTTTTLVSSLNPSNVGQ